MNFQNILLEEKGSVAIVTINRPDKLNALNAVLISELETVFSYLGEKEDIRAVILTGSGEKAFVAGADISEINSLDMISGKEFAEKGQAVFSLIENLNKPVIACINGYCLGGGLEIALACDFRVASEDSRLGLPEITLGIMPGAGGTQRLPRLVGMGIAKEMILGGGQINAQRAYEIGLVNRVIPPENLLEEARKFARKLTKLPPFAMKVAKDAINYGYDLSLDNAIKLEIACILQCFSTQDQKEGMKAFVEKRKPAFTGK